MTERLRLNPWQGLDRQAFHENAILLDLKCRVQGHLLKPSAVPLHNGLHRDESTAARDARCFLDDMALVVAGNGGKENVTAVTMEKGQEGTLTIRIAQNDGVDLKTCPELESLLKIATQQHPNSLQSDNGAHIEYDEILSLILSRCKGRLQKHTQRFTNELRHACWPAGISYIIPKYSGELKTESRHDIDNLGVYNAATHASYMALNADRSTRLRDLCECQSVDDLSTIKMIVKIAYQVRRSASFRHFVRSNIGPRWKPMTREKFANDLVERIGKMSRFCRAAHTIAAFGQHLAQNGESVVVKPLPTKRYSVTELNQRTIKDLRRRGGRIFTSCKDDQFWNMLQRWKSYRLHAEIQHVIFYEENPPTGHVTPYIGCDKLCCYLCYQFLVAHGRFRPSGTHQSLYSLWTLPVGIVFESAQRAENFKAATETICADLERKMARIRQQSSLKSMFPTNNESWANLSRVSLIQHFINPRGAGGGPLRIDSSSRKQSHEMISIVEEGDRDCHVEVCAEQIVQPCHSDQEPGCVSKTTHSQQQVETECHTESQRPGNPIENSTSVETEADHHYYRRRRRRRRRRHLSHTISPVDHVHRTGSNRRYKVRRRLSQGSRRHNNLVSSPSRHGRGDRSCRRRRGHRRYRESFFHSLYRRFLNLFR